MVLVSCHLFSDIWQRVLLVCIRMAERKSSPVVAKLLICPGKHFMTKAANSKAEGIDHVVRQLRTNSCAERRYRTHLEHLASVKLAISRPYHKENLWYGNLTPQS